MLIKNKNIVRKVVQVFALFVVICLNIVGCGGKDNPVAVNKDIVNYIKHESNNITYTFKNIVQHEIFELSIYVPEDFPVNITDFEFWVDNELIGERTPVVKTLRHLALQWNNTNNVQIRLYNNDEQVAECQIDPTDETGTLDFQ
jgi:hypothetical protein